MPDVEGAETGPIERPKAPKCPICHGSLHFGNEWHCPTCGFRYQVDRGRVGPPLWGGMTEPEPEEKEEYDESMHEAFMEYLLSGGWTKESYEKLSERAKHELFEKWKEIAGF